MIINKLGLYAWVRISKSNRMKEGLSGSIVNEMEVNDRWEHHLQEARKLLERLKQNEAELPKKMIKDSKICNTIKSENYDTFFILIMTKRKNERFKRSK